MAEPLSGTVLLVDRIGNTAARLYQEPSQILTCRSLEEVPAYLARLEALRKQGAHLAGYFSYEFGMAFEEKLRSTYKLLNSQDLAWFGVYEAPKLLSRQQQDQWLESFGSTGTPSHVEIEGFDLSEEEYAQAFSKTQSHLKQGDVYQINLTMRTGAHLSGNPVNLFNHLLFQQPVSYAAYIKTERQTVLSISPELFLERRGQKLTTRPMKGTAPRGRTPTEDMAAKQWLRKDQKSRAENTMILDLMRNDLSRITKAGSVQVEQLCHVETYRSILQMTSTTSGLLSEGAELPQIMEQLFPCGSITGAPKLRAMEIIKELEASERGIYTGSIGYIDPSGDFTFNVAIRTLVINGDGAGVIGAGSGVVYDSGSAPEYEECKLKLGFFQQKEGPFTLFETLAWTKEYGYLLEQRHLKRLRDSAEYFGFPFDMNEAFKRLNTELEAFSSPMRVRIDLDHLGKLSVSCSPLPSRFEAEPVKVILASERVNSSDRFLFHKTSRRSFYDKLRLRYQKQTECFEVLFQNERSFLTEGSFTNLFIERDGVLLTPRLTHGLLAGTFRAALLEKALAFEADLTLQDLLEADRLFIGNSVRGLMSAQLTLMDETKERGNSLTPMPAPIY
ncbi:aminodeoxychorismate synthase component I [Flexibacterium corallicola]|uniref:aminodeoxychorismate synthase component I n=1 Tax=Flexibacterium corallicola TaxID=3037259 RepID=UPI00286F118B|nr:aminodeoxychorismate synthase component I [Pseudovibrio sp. M1P-2-3]